MVPGESHQVVPQGIYACSSDEPRVLCIIRDLTGLARPTVKVILNLPASTTGVQLMEEVGNKFRYFPDSFDLVLQRITDQESIPVNDLGDQTLEELGFRCNDCRNNLIITEKNGVAPRKIEIYTDVESKAADVRSDVRFKGSGDMSECSTTYVPPPAPPPYSPGSAEFAYNYICTQTSLRQDTGFVGLVNQAMTCYLNSLLQTLYMTPEFRNALYRWEFDGTEEEGVKSIPFQLQKLFLLLQTSKKPAVGTTELTTSFGWDSSEAWQQHDVQELCRVMFDALEQTFKNTDQSDLISKHYEGKLKDYVKCLQCGYESAREDTFLDVPLVVRPFGSSRAYGSVEEALYAFVTPEILEGCNQYFCEQCNKKCDAHKGLKFTKFPYLLTLQLKRFDFDPVTMHRIKLNDRVSFPEILNLNTYVKLDIFEETCGDGDATDCDDLMLYALFPKTGGSLLFPETHSGNNDVVDDDEGIDVGLGSNSSLGHNNHTSNDQKNRKSVAVGPYVYELFSIMVHSGSADGGHYYAYIKSFKDGEWYCFNDTQVTKITYEDIQKTYGGGPSRGYYSSSYSSSTNAYMLMYRQIDKEKNAGYMMPEELPEHIQVLLRGMLEQEEQERQQKELDRNMCKIKLFGSPPNQRRIVEYTLKIHKSTTLSEATATAQTLLGYEGLIPLDCCRLVKYDDFHDSLECSFENADDVPMGELLEGVKSSYKFDLLLETKKPTEKFEVYKPGGTTVKVYSADLERGEVSPFCTTVRSHLCDTVQEFKNKIAQILGIQSETIRAALEVFQAVKLLNDPTKTLNSEGFLRSNKVFIEYNDVSDAVKPFESSEFYRILDEHAHMICILVSLPRVDKGILERLRIHDNDVEDSKDGSGSDGESNDDATSIPDAGFSEKISEDVPMNSVFESDSKKTKVTSDCWSENVKSVHTSCNVDMTKKTQISVTPDDPSQDYDEGLGDSEVGDFYFPNNYHGNQTVHSDQSEDSSLTDSERTLVGDELSPRNNSPDIMGSEIDQDLESPQHASADTSKPECDTMQHMDNLSCSLNKSSENNKTLSSPEENTKASECSSGVKHHSNESSSPPVLLAENPVPQENVEKRYFRAWPYVDSESTENMLRVYLDKRISFAGVKKNLEPYIGVEADYFKIYKIYSNNQEFECTRLNENLMSFTEDTKLTVKLGRALRKGEYKVKIYQLCVNDSEPSKFLIDWVFVKGMTVLTAKKEILPEIKEKLGLNIPLQRCRLRKKNWKNPSTIFFDGQQFETDIQITANWEVFLEILTEPETMYPWKMSIFTKRWHPDKYELDPFEEIIFENCTVGGFKSKLSEVSGIPEEHIEFAKGKGAFPSEISTLSIHKELDWYSQLSPLSALNAWPLCINDHGYVVYYRDARIQPKRLTEEEKRLIINKENARSNKIRKTCYSPRKEKALKIYTLDSSLNSPCNNVQSNLSLAVD